MRIIKGNKKIELYKPDLDDISGQYKKVIIDLGTGDGRFVYKSAIKDTENLYIGIDPSEKSLEEFSKKAVKDKINNTMFVVGSIEVFPEELFNSADELYVNLPWGSLLQFVSQPTNENVEKLKEILKPTGKLKVTFGYQSDLEPSETQRLNLEPISQETFQEKIIPVYEKNGFVLDDFHKVNSQELKMLESTWGKKISLRLDRPMFFLAFHL